MACALGIPAWAERSVRGRTGGGNTLISGSRKRGAREGTRLCARVSSRQLASARVSSRPKQHFAADGPRPCEMPRACDELSPDDLRVGSLCQSRHSCSWIASCSHVRCGRGGVQPCARQAPIFSSFELASIGWTCGGNRDASTVDVGSVDCGLGRPWSCF